MMFRTTQTKNWTYILHDIVLGLVYILTSLANLLIENISIFADCMIFLCSTAYILYFSLRFHLLRHPYLQNIFGKILVFITLEFLYIIAYVISSIVGALISLYFYGFGDIM